jgi:hypothetical protein
MQEDICATLALKPVRIIGQSRFGHKEEAVFCEQIFGLLKPASQMRLTATRKQRIVCDSNRRESLKSHD